MLEDDNGYRISKIESDINILNNMKITKLFLKPLDHDDIN